MIRINGLTKSFGKLAVLRGVDLEIGAGRVTALVGPNGAGKTTLIKIILGLTRGDGGKVLFDGERIGDDPEYRARIGYMPQIARFPDNLTAAELFALHRDLRAQPARADEGLIDRLRLRGEMDRSLRTLSGGTRQKVNAVLAFLFNPDVLILDEPTAGLDPVASAILKDRILEARGAGRTVIVTSHILNELDELADDVAFLADGRMRFSGPVHDLKLATRQLNLERAIAQIMMEDAVA
jgi:Cu-processing system ATP-binding protein